MSIKEHKTTQFLIICRCRARSMARSGTACLTRAGERGRAARRRAAGRCTRLRGALGAEEAEDEVKP